MFNKERSQLCVCHCTRPTGSDKWGNLRLQLSSCLRSQHSSIFEHCNLQRFHRSSQPPWATFMSYRHWQTVSLAWTWPRPRRQICEKLC